MRAGRFRNLGLAGSAFLALCCVTPFLPWALGLVGLTGLTGFVYRDTVLLPLLAGFVVIAGVGLWLSRKTSR